MPFLETPNELAEEIANWCGVYGAHEDGEEKICRVCFVDSMSNRIRKSVDNERLIDATKGEG